ncbi:phage major capsid protein [Cupriavidus sp. amp6]|uniref:phage major capsid protein n=1 Tax=Cupriavidus sp. amp6 TaxID=388051 RepID=UPI00041ABC85|nr:phage major capsid protein [Cupriavidus sp. amp6]
MNISEKVRQAEADAMKLKGRLTNAIQCLEAAPDEDGLLSEVRQLTSRVNAATKTLDAYKRAEAVRSKRSPAPSAPAIIHHCVEPKVGDILFKHAVVALLAHVERKPVAQVIQERYGNAPFVKATWNHIQKCLMDPAYQKSAVDPAMTTTTGWAAELVRNDVRGYIDTLKDVSVAAALSGFATSLNFDGFNSIVIPKRNPAVSGLTEPAWVSEGSPIPLTQFSFGSTIINRFKLAAITTMSREIAERSTPAIEDVLREALREAHAEVLDAALLSDVAAVVNVRPAGLQNAAAWGSETRAGAAGGGEEAVRADIVAMLAGLTAHKLGARPVLMINNLDRLAVGMISSAMSELVFAAELANGTLLSIPVISSANVPQHLAVMVDAAYVATAFDIPQFEVSDIATVVEASADATVPTMADTTPGEVPPGGGLSVGAGGKARSLWQTYSLGIRMVAPTSWSVVQPGAVQSVTATTWS